MFGFFESATESQLVLRPTGLTFASPTPRLSRRLAAWDDLGSLISACLVWTTCIGHWDASHFFHCGTRVRVFFFFIQEGKTPETE